MLFSALLASVSPTFLSLRNSLLPLFSNVCTDVHHDRPCLAGWVRHTVVVALSGRLAVDALAQISTCLPLPASHLPCLRCPCRIAFFLLFYFLSFLSLPLLLFPFSFLFSPELPPNVKKHHHPPSPVNTHHAHRHAAPLHPRHTLNNPVLASPLVLTFGLPIYGVLTSTYTLQFTLEHALRPPPPKKKKKNQKTLVGRIGRHLSATALVFLSGPVSSQSSQSVAALRAARPL